MATLAPLRSVHYDYATLASVVAPPYDVISKEERARLASKSPHNVVHLDLPAGEGDARYANAASLLATWRSQGVLRESTEPEILRYEQTFTPPDGGPRVTRRGFICLVRAEPYSKRVVLPHERTLSGPKEDRYKLFCATKTALSPVFLLYRDPSATVAPALDRAVPVCEFTTEDGIEHRVAALRDPAAIERIVRALSRESLLIADGHHRYETTLRYGETIDAELRAAGKPVEERAAHHFVLSFLADADDPGLVVFPTHRIVHGVPGFDRERFMQRAGEAFDVATVSSDDVAVLTQKLAESGRGAPTVAVVFPDGATALLSLKRSFDPGTHPVLGARSPALRRTDVVILHDVLIEGVLGVSRDAQALQSNLEYVKSSSDAVARIRRGDGQILFLMNATPVAHVRESCLDGEVMPQKSTYFFPKVLTGIAMHLLDPRAHC